jgi:hypothetical protein
VYVRKVYIVMCIGVAQVIVAIESVGAYNALQTPATILDRMC